MKPITSRTHAIIDYVVGILLLLAPFLLGFADVEPARNAAWIVGIATLLYSMATAYEISVVKLIPYRIHLGLDLIGGLFLAASPWVMNFDEFIVWPHVLVGVLEIGVALLSRPAAALHPAERSLAPDSAPTRH
jgi:hypothetical protein